MHRIQRKKRRFGALAALVLAALAVWGALRAAVPDMLYLEPGRPLTLASLPFLQAGAPAADAAAPAASTATGGSQNTTLRLFGVLPVKTVRTVQAARRTVLVSGAPFGVKMLADGALIVAFSDQYTALGAENPAKAAGLRLGDLIVSAGGVPVRGNADLTAAVTAAAGRPLTIEYRRGGAQCTATLTPVADRDTGAWRAGVWVRDSSAGIGTLTFTDPEHATFAGLGHAVSDTDTGEAFALLSGEIVPVAIRAVRKGAAGSPGELKGEFSGTAMGTVRANDATGVYGVLTGAAPAGEALPVANIQEVAPGDAEILVTLSGTEPQRYAVRIERVDLTAADPNRNLLLRVTDERLLQTTGGIVQGMSGSPIVQNDRLVGAVTHVLVNDPARGYGIFAATMLEKADAAAG